MSQDPETGDVTYEMPDPQPVPRRAIIVPLGYELVEKMLRLPYGWKIVSVLGNWHTDQVELKVTGPTAPVVAEGAEPVTVYCGIVVGDQPEDPRLPPPVTIVLPDWAGLEEPMTVHTYQQAEPRNRPDAPDDQDGIVQQFLDSPSHVRRALGETPGAPYVRTQPHRPDPIRDWPQA